MRGLYQDYSNARFNVARNTWTAFAAESTCLRMVYSIDSKTYRAEISSSLATRRIRWRRHGVVTSG